MARKNRMAFREDDGYIVLDMGEMEIWDGADLALLRDTLTQVIDVEKAKKVGVNLAFVKYIPSGFFGMLFDWHEKGVALRVYKPKPHVQNMLWFRQFFEDVVDGTYQLLSEPKFPMFVPSPTWNKNSQWPQVVPPVRNNGSSPTETAAADDSDTNVNEETIAVAP